MATPKSAIDIQGFEYDWLGVDEGGYVALFSTAGAGYAPKAFLRDTDAHDQAIEAILALTAMTDAKLAPAVAPGCGNTWRLVADRGLYAYDSDPNGGPYRLLESPDVAARVDALPAEIAHVAVRLRGLRFDTQSVITHDMLRAAED